MCSMWQRCLKTAPHLTEKEIYFEDFLMQQFFSISHVRWVQLYNDYF